MSLTITRDEWLKALEDVGVSDEDDQGALTVAEFMEMFGVPRFTAERRLRHLAATGKATRTRKRGRTPDGRSFSFIAYRLA